MSYRSALVNSLVSIVLTELDGTRDTLYYTNIYKNVKTKTLDFSEITDYPTITITPGSESIRAAAGMVKEHDLTIYIRIYDESQDDIEALIEKRIIDIETILDKYKTISYTVTKPNGQIDTDYTKMIDISQISTDEGLLKPRGIGEIILSVKYDTLRRLI